MPPAWTLALLAQLAMAAPGVTYFDLVDASDVAAFARFHSLALWHFFDLDGAQIQDPSEVATVERGLSLLDRRVVPLPRTGCQCQPSMPWAAPRGVCAPCSKRQGQLVLEPNEQLIEAGCGFPNTTLPYSLPPFIKGISQPIIDGAVCTQFETSPVGRKIAAILDAIAEWLQGREPPHLHTYTANTTSYWEQSKLVYTDPLSEVAYKMRRAVDNTTDLRFAPQQYRNRLHKLPMLGRCALVGPAGILRNRNLVAEITREHDTVLGMSLIGAMLAGDPRDVPTELDYFIQSGSHAQDLHNATGSTGREWFEALARQNCIVDFPSAHFKLQAVADAWWPAVFGTLHQRCAGVAGVISGEIYLLWWHFKRQVIKDAPSYGGRAGPLILFLLKHCSSIRLHGVYAKDVLGIDADYHVESKAQRTLRQDEFKVLGPPAQSTIDLAIFLGLHCRGIIDIRM